MSVIGFDFGNENCFIAVARAGGIETIANDYSQRITPAYVAFGEKQRDLGVSAKNKQNTNIKSTVYGFKRLIGRKMRDPQVQAESTFLPYQLVELNNGEIGVVVRYLGEETQFSAHQITAMLFTKLKETAETALKIKVNDCVISVPLFFNDAERRAIMDASKIAGLNCLKLMNETTAVALSYGFYKNDLPEDKPKLVAFVDMGHSALQVSIVAFNKDKLKMLCCESDAVGGRDFDRTLVEYFCDDFQARYKLDVRSNKRAFIRLAGECEKIKKQMSSIALELPMNIECFMEDKDVSGKMNRETFEELAAPLMKRVEMTLVNAIANCPSAEEGKVTTPEDIDSVEIVGGSSRVPAVKALVKKVFGREPSTTLNQDEAVSRGCALQCAMLSPNFKVRDFNITDVQPYPIAARISPAIDTENCEYDVFPRFHPVPFSRALSVFRKQPFSIEAFYRDPVPFPEKSIGVYTVNVVPSSSEPSDEDKVKVKVRVNPNGIFSVVQATLFEKNEELAEGDATPGEANGDEVQGVEKVESQETMETDQKDKEGKKKPKSKQTDLLIDSRTGHLAQGELTNLFEREAKMILADRMEKQRLDAKNAVEEYVYEMRDKLSDVLTQFATEQEREALGAQLTQTEDWLYGDGEDLEKPAYVDRLDTLLAIGQPIVERFREAQERPRALEEFGGLLQRIRKAVGQFEGGEEQYGHLASEDMERLAKALDEKQQWYDQVIGKVNNTPAHLPPPVFVKQIVEEGKTLERMATQILNKPKPKPPTPPKEEPAEKKEDPQEPMATEEDQNEAQFQQNPAEPHTQTQPEANGDRMDVE